MRCAAAGVHERVVATYLEKLRTSSGVSEDRLASGSFIIAPPAGRVRLRRRNDPVRRHLADARPVSSHVFAR
jgi:hypothetical protein